MSGWEQDPTLKRPDGGAPVVDLPEGLEVGEYRVLRKIGQGGMGSVYAAVHPVIGKRVAIKVLAPQIAAHPELVRRFIDEARAVNKIGHPNIVDIFSFGWLADQRHYFVMEYLEGQSLADRLKNGQQGIDRIEASRLLGQICGALEAAHQAGIVHRDLKPDNIWVAQPKHGQSFAKLLDFGIAKLMVETDSTAKTQTGAIMGTPAYMSPEQCRGVGVDPRTDIYALGVILYEMFTGQTPFRGAFVELITQHLGSAPYPPSKLRAISKPLERLILVCLEKEPGRRPASAAALGAELTAALADEAALPSGATEEASTDTLQPLAGKTSPGATLVPARTPRAWLWLGATGAVVLVAGLAIVNGRHPDGRTPPPRPPLAAGDSAPSAGAGAGVPAAPDPAGRARAVVQNTDSARFFIDARLVASGGREADVGGVAADRPHVLRVEADGWAPFERRFTVAAAGLVEMQVALTRDGVPSVAPGPAPTAAEHGAGARPAATAPRGPAAPPRHAPSPLPGGKAPRHRDGLVGDDIFDTSPPRQP